MKKLILLTAVTLLALSLAACATPQTFLKGPKGDVVHCGGGMAGSAAGGLIGYHIEKDMDKSCVAKYQSLGYKII